MKTTLHNRYFIEEDPAVGVSLDEWRNIQSGQLRALIFVGSLDFGKGDMLAIVAPERELNCIVKSVWPLGDSSMSVVSLQPEAQRRREINRRKSFRALHLAYERLAARGKGFR